ncbi:hypothetical protein D3C87_68330 [compost metagenome]
MKTLKLLIAGFGLFVASSLQAQVSVNVNIGSRPDWGPVGYTEANYYYLPDIEAYYDVRASNFIYISNGNWIRGRYLPARYRNYDLYNGYKVVLTDYHGARPYAHFNTHRVKYYRGNRPHTVVVRDVHHYHDNHKHYKKHKAKKHHRHHHDD